MASKYLVKRKTSIKEKNEIYLDASLGGYREGTIGVPPRVVIVDTIPHKEVKDGVWLSKLFFLSLLGIIALLMLLLAFLLGRYANWRQLSESTIIKITAPIKNQKITTNEKEPNPVTVATSPAQVVSLPPQKVIIKYLPPVNEVPKAASPGSKISQQQDEEDEEIRFVPQDISFYGAPLDPTLRNNSEKISRYVTNIEQFLLKTSTWQNFYHLLSNLQQGVLVGEKGRINLLIKEVRNKRSRISILEIPPAAREHHAALLYFISQGESFLVELSNSLSGNKIAFNKLHDKKIYDKVQPLLDQMNNLNEMTIFLKEEAVQK